MSYSRCKKLVNAGYFSGYWVLCVSVQCGLVIPMLNVGQNNKININIPVGTDQLKIAINRVFSAAQCAELLLEWIETVNLKTVEA